MLSGEFLADFMLISEQWDSPWVLWDILQYPGKELVPRLILSFTTTKLILFFLKPVYLQVIQCFGQRSQTSLGLTFGPLDFHMKSLSPLGKDLFKIPTLGSCFQAIYGPWLWMKI